MNIYIYIWNDMIPRSNDGRKRRKEGVHKNTNPPFKSNNKWYALDQKKYIIILNNVTAFHERTKTAAS